MKNVPLKSKADTHNKDWLIEMKDANMHESHPVIHILLQKSGLTSFGSYFCVFAQIV